MTLAEVLLVFILVIFAILVVFIGISFPSILLALSNNIFIGLVFLGLWIKLRNLSKRVRFLESSIPQTQPKLATDESINTCVDGDDSPTGSPSAALLKDSSPTLFSDKLSWLRGNWTGVFGLGILVLGLVFLQAYMSLYSTPLYRFLYLVIAACVMLSGSLYLRYKCSARWQDVSSWLQSGASAVFLLATCGSSHLEALKFYESTSMGSILFFAGIGVSFLNNWFNPLPLGASFSAILNFVALYMAPSSLMISTIAFLSAIFGVGALRKHHEKWHLAPILVGFAVFSYFCTGKDVLDQYYYVLLGQTGLVGLSAILLSFQRPCAILSLKEVAVMTSGWILLAVDCYDLSHHLLFRMLTCAAAALVCFAISYRHEIIASWRRHVYLFLSLMFVVSGTVAAFYQYHHCMLIGTMVLLEVSFFALLYEKNNINNIQAINYVLVLSALGGYVFMLMNDPTNPLIHISNAILFLAVPIITRLLRNQDDKLHGISSAFWHIKTFLILLIGLYFYHESQVVVLSFEWFVLPLAYVLARFIEPKTMLSQPFANLASTFVFTTSTIHTIHAIQDIGGQAFMAAMGMISIGLHLLPKYPQGDHFYKKDLPLYGGLIYLVVVAELILRGFSNFLPGIVFLVISALLIELRGSSSRLLRHVSGHDASLTITNMAMILLWAFMRDLTLVYLQSQAYLVGSISMRLALGVTGSCCAALALSVWSPNDQSTLSRKIHATLGHSGYEFIIITALILISFDLPVYVQNIAFSVLSLLISYTCCTFAVPKRFNTYARIALLGNVVHVAVISSYWNSPCQAWYAKTHLSGIVSLIILMCSGMFLQKSSPTKKCLLMNILPVMAASALFVYWRFDGLYLTLIYILLVAALALIGLYFAYKPLVDIAFLAMAVCAIRLIFYDIHAENILIKSLVFTGAGSLMLLTNLMYKKHIGRLQ